MNLNDFLQRNERSVFLFSIAVLILLNIGIMIRLSVTIDEVWYIFAGYQYLTQHISYIGHPILLPLLVSAPLTIALSFTNTPLITTAPALIYGTTLAPSTALLIARLATLPFTVALGFFVFKWARSWYGRVSGFVALLLYVFSPTILGHSSLVIHDLWLTAFFFIAVYSYWNYFESPTRRTMLYAGLWTVLSIMAKTPGYLLLPLFLVLSFIHAYFSEKESSLSKAIFKTIHEGKTVLLFVGLLLLTIFAVYAGDNYPFQQVDVDRIPTFLGPAKNIAQNIFDRGTTPPAFSYFGGLLGGLSHSIRGHVTYLFGEYSSTGWWYYYPVLFLLKVPLAFLALLALRTALVRNTTPRERLQDLFLLIPILAFFLLFITTNVSNALRNILPIFPFLFVYVSRLSTYKPKRIKWFPLFLALLLALFAASSLSVYPHSLAYFNEAAGGPAEGYQYVLDSNVDWGQDLNGLIEYAHENSLTDLYVNYDTPLEGLAYAGITAHKIPCTPTTGWIAIGANARAGLLPSDRACYTWLQNYTPTARIGYSLFVFHIPESVN